MKSVDDGGQFARLFADPDVEPWRTKIARAAQALFHEQAGESDAAMAIWRVWRANLDTREMTLRSRVDAAIKRLQPARAMRYRRIAARRRRLSMTPPDDRAGSAR